MRRIAENQNVVGISEIEPLAFNFEPRPKSYATLPQYGLQMHDLGVEVLGSELSQAWGYRHEVSHVSVASDTSGNFPLNRSLFQDRLAAFGCHRLLPNARSA